MAFQSEGNTDHEKLFMLSLNTILASGTVSYFFPTLMGALGYEGRMVQCKSI